MAKTKKAPAATAADPFFDAEGHPLAVNDLVLVSQEGASIYNGHSGTISALHREGANAVATVAFQGDSTVAAGSQGFFLKWLTYVASHPVIQDEPDLPWLDCDGNVLHEGDKATVLPDVSARLSGKLVKVLGEYDPKKKSVQVEPVGWEGNDFGILLCFLKRLPVLGENLAEPFDYSTLPHKEEVLAEQDQQAASRKQEPVAPFAVPGQAAFEAALASAPEPHRVGWAHKDGSQLNHHYDAQGATACGYKRKAGALHFPDKPETLSRWQRCEKCDAQFTPAAPAPVTQLATTGLHVVPLASIVVTTNTRKVFDETALAELAESVRAHGILQPIVLRPHTEAGQYELVAGGRRYRAAQLAGLAEMPATVRNLNDREFMEVQLLENLQRVDVRPADEAQAFSKLLKNDFSAEEVALKVGKPVKFVLQRAKLVNLIPFWFEALEDEKLVLVAAHELARLPAHSQLAIKHEVEKRPDYYAKGYSKTDIRNIINDKVLRKLDKAPWDKADASLVPSAGPCTLCPKRSAAQGVLFEMKEGIDLCLDASCFAAKRMEFVARRLAQVTLDQGKAPVCVSSEYSPSQELVKTGVTSYQHFSWSDEQNPAAVQVLVMDGSEAGQLKYARFYNAKSAAASSPEAIAAEKKEQAERIRRERTRKMHRTLLAEALTADLPTAIADESTAAHAALDYFILEELGGKATAKVDYLKTALGWEPTEAALKDDYTTHDALGFRPWKSWLIGKLDELEFPAKLHLFFILKVRHRMDHEYEDLQFDIAKLAGETYNGVAAEAEQAVELRYYTRKGKKQEATA